MVLGMPRLQDDAAAVRRRAEREYLRYSDCIAAASTMLASGRINIDSYVRLTDDIRRYRAGKLRAARILRGDT